MRLSTWVGPGRPLTARCTGRGSLHGCRARGSRKETSRRHTGPGDNRVPFPGVHGDRGLLALEDAGFRSKVASLKESPQNPLLWSQESELGPWTAAGSAAGAQPAGPSPAIQAHFMAG